MICYTNSLTYLLT